MDRFVPRAVNEALERALPPGFARAFSAPLEIYCPAANSPVDVPHGLAAIPDGYLVLWQDAPLVRTPGQAWTPDLAFLQSPTDHARACVVFLLLTEAPRYVGPTL